jgi:hypothetical protein
MMNPNITTSAMISVWCDWNGWHPAMTRVTDLEDIRWLQPEQTVQAQVPCSKVLLGITQACSNRPNSRLPVYVLRSEIHPTAFEELSQRIIGGSSNDAH